MVFNELDLILGAEDPVHLISNLEGLGSGMFCLLHGICFLHKEFLLS